VVITPFSTAWSEDGAGAPDNDIFAAEAESSAIQFVHHFPMLVDPSVGYALSQTNQTPTATGKASVVEPGLVGRVALYTYGKRRDKDGSIQAGIIEIPLSSECAYPDPPGPQQVTQSATMQPPSTDAQPKDPDTGAGIAVCRSDARPGNYSHASAGEGAAGGLTFKSLAATSTTERQDGGNVVSKSESTVRGIKIADVMTIEEITSSANAVSGRADGSETAAAAVQVVGAIVQGQRVAITDSGVVVKDPQPGTSLAEAQKGVDDALSKAAVSVRLLSATHNQAAEPGKATAYSGGVIVSYANEKAEKALSYILGQSRVFSKHHRAGGDDAGRDEGQASASATPQPYAWRQE
jgi:hypothetical protein